MLIQQVPFLCHITVSFYEGKKIKSLKKTFWNATIHNVKCCSDSSISQDLHSNVWLPGTLEKAKLSRSMKIKLQYQCNYTESATLTPCIFLAVGADILQ